MSHRILIIFTVLCGTFPSATVGQTQKSFNELLDDLTHPDRAMEAAEILREQALAQPKVRTELGIVLPALLLPANDVDVLQSEATLAGKLRLVSTIPALIRLLDEPANRGLGCLGPRAGCAEMGTMTTRFEMRDDPIARALGDIGEPAVPSLSVPLNSAHLVPRTRAARILIFIGTPGSFAVLQRHVDRETDKGLKEYIAANLDRFRELSR